MRKWQWPSDARGCHAACSLARSPESRTQPVRQRVPQPCAEAPAATRAHDACLHTAWALRHCTILTVTELKPNVARASIRCNYLSASQGWQPRQRRPRGVSPERPGDRAAAPLVAVGGGSDSNRRERPRRTRS
ncbi:unnamed protein product [Lampetra planeri]